MPGLFLLQPLDGGQPVIAPIGKHLIAHQQRMPIISEALDRAKGNAPGWDIYRLMEIYANGINERGEPKSINAAFPAWCGKYTKGKRP